MKRVLTKLQRVLQAIGHEIAATIRFGAIPSAAAPTGRPAQSNSAAAVAGMTVLGSDESEKGKTVET